jgi:hypothetical protein
MSRWKLLRYEYEGFIPDKAWVTNGRETALFKPDTQNKESEIEYEAYKIAKALGISHAKTEIIELSGIIGTLSYNFKTDHDMVYRPVGKLYSSASSDPAHRDEEVSENPLTGVNISVEDIRNNPDLKPLEAGAIDMLFFDCLISNRDRHGHNWEIMINKPAKEITGLAPLFDHGAAMWNHFAPEYDDCIVPWTGRRLLKHYEMFEKLAKDYPEQIGDLLSKCENIKLNAFVKERYEVMQNIFRKIGNVSSKLSA